VHNSESLIKIEYNVDHQTLELQDTEEMLAIFGDTKYTKKKQ